LSSNSTTPDDDALDWIFGKPEDDAIMLAAQRDHLVMLAHSACDVLLELTRLYKKLQQRGDKLGPIDTLPWGDAIEELETARRRYVRSFKLYDAPQIIREAATNFAGDKVATVIENSMTSWRERLYAEAAASLERERAKG
jgi:hypothetical protein